jgi:hypothetical protein
VSGIIFLSILVETVSIVVGTLDELSEHESREKSKMNADKKQNILYIKIPKQSKVIW